MSASPRLTVRAVVIQDDMLLLSKYHDERGFWHVVPGGGVENGETVEEAFQREMMEEVGMHLPFGDVLFMREIIADRHSKTNLKPGFHQVELYVRSRVPPQAKLASTAPDFGQVDLIWHPLAQLDEILFFPIGLVKNFQEQQWPTFYYGEMR